jgi:hypothetical protein
MNCSDTGCPFGLVGCEGIDVALDFRECPPVKYVLDASLYSPPMVGDDVCVYGGFGAYGNIRNYRATIGDLYGSAENADREHFSGNAIIQPNYSYLVGAEQIEGFSGSCALNGYGITGIASSMDSLNIDKTHAVIVRWVDVVRCMDKHMSEIKSLSHQCDVAMLSPPTLLSWFEIILLPFVPSKILAML